MKIFTDEQIRLFQTIIEFGSERGVAAYVVGGVIRDLYLGHSPMDKDIDFIIEGNAIDFAEHVNRSLQGKLKSFKDFYTAKILNPQGYSKIKEVDFASSRTEEYSSPGKLPTVRIAHIKDDLRRRDFSINAMAVSCADLLDWAKSDQGIEKLRECTMDLFGGYKDIADKVVRVLHQSSFKDDPTRIFRAIRYAARISGQLDPQTEILMKKSLKDNCLETVSNQRKLNELKKILSENRYDDALRMLIQLGIFDSFSLFKTERVEQAVDLIKAIRNGEASISEDLFYNACLRVFFYCSYEKKHELAESQALYSRLGFGSNEIRKLVFDTKSDLDLSNKQVIQRLTVSGRLFQKALKSYSLLS